jgi:hypothetical protein
MAQLQARGPAFRAAGRRPALPERLAPKNRYDGPLACRACEASLWPLAFFFSREPLAGASGDFLTGSWRDGVRTRSARNSLSETLWGAYSARLGQARGRSYRFRRARRSGNAGLWPAALNFRPKGQSPGACEASLGRPQVAAHARRHAPQTRPGFHGSRSAGLLACCVGNDERVPC